MQSIAETCVRFDAAHLSINLVSEIAVPMFTTLIVAVKESRNPAYGLYSPQPRGCTPQVQHCISHTALTVMLYLTHTHILAG